MKKIHIVLLATSLLAFVAAIPIQGKGQPSVSFQVFYDQMGPYGSWVNYQDYGYVWVPTEVPHGFRPYATGGHWVYTPDGWTWVSDYPWGWAAFHYGNWFYDDSYGWMWLPGYDWAPAWVTWGEYGDDYCWAPIAPRIDIGVSFGSYRPPAFSWTFASRAHITSSNLSRYYVNHPVTVVNRITVINNINRGSGGHTFMRGPQAQNVERYTHTTIKPVQFSAAARPGRGRLAGGQLALYRPAINRNNGSSRPAPSRVEDVHHLQPSALPAVNRHVQPNNKSTPNKNEGAPRAVQPAAAPARRTVTASHPTPAPTGHSATMHRQPAHNATESRPAGNPAPNNRPPNQPAHSVHPATNPTRSRPQPAHANHPVNPPPAHRPPAPQPNKKDEHHG